MRQKTIYSESPSEMEVWRVDEFHCTIVFRENVEESETEDGIRYSADEYHLTVPYRENLEEAVRKKIDLWRNKAIADDYAKAAAQVRDKRNALLADTDKDMAIDRLLSEGVTDSTLQSIAGSRMAEYRQSLRDIPEQDGFPYDVQFPEKPSGTENSAHTTTYSELVEAYIRERYSISQELAIQRQRYTKEAEFAEYFAYCEECKTRAREEMAAVS